MRFIADLVHEKSNWWKKQKPFCRKLKKQVEV